MSARAAYRSDSHTTNREARQHPDAADKVQVYDAMARRNRAELWGADGTVIRRREGK